MSLFDDFTNDDEEDDDSAYDDAEDIADSGESFVHPRAMEMAFGHEEIEQRLLQLYETGRMPQALVFSGPSGIGKATIAYRFARFLLKQGVKDNNQGGLFGDAPVAPENMSVSAHDPVFRQVASGAHPDLLSIERPFDENKNRYKDAVNVESVRKVAPFLRKTSSDGGWRIVIIDDADTMNRNAQNALLKILEEPPANSLLILVTHRSGALIPTIRSRAQVIGFSPLKQDVLLQALQKHSPNISTTQANFLMSFAEGSLGSALHAMEQDVFSVFASLMTIWSEWPQWNRMDIHAMADDLASNGREQAYEIFKDLVLWCLFMIARSKARNTPLDVVLASQKGLQSFRDHSSLEEILEICENLRSSFDKVDFANLDKRQAVPGAFALIASS